MQEALLWRKKNDSLRVVEAIISYIRLRKDLKNVFRQHVVIRNTPRLPYAIGLITAYLQTQHMLENVENVPKVKENKKDVQIFDTTNEQNANLAIAFQKMLVEAIRVPERTMSMRSFRKVRFYIEKPF